MKGSYAPRRGGQTSCPLESPRPQSESRYIEHSRQEWKVKCKLSSMFVLNCGPIACVRAGMCRAACMGSCTSSCYLAVLEGWGRMSTSVGTSSVLSLSFGAGKQGQKKEVREKTHHYGSPERIWARGLKGRWRQSLSLPELFVWGIG